MDNKKGLLQLISIVVLSISLLIASKLISDAINNVGVNLLASSSNFFSDGNSGGIYELIVEDGWMFLYDTTNGQVFKADSNTTPYKWEEVRHFSR